MSTTKYNHIVFIKSGAGSLYEGRAAGGGDLILKPHQPYPIGDEPVKDEQGRARMTVPPAFADRLVEDGYAVHCTENGEHKPSEQKVLDNNNPPPPSDAPPPAEALSNASPAPPDAPDDVAAAATDEKPKDAKGAAKKG